MNPFESARLAVGRRGASTWDEDMRLMWNAALEEAARVCQSHEPKDFTVAGICTRARCAQVILALKEKE